MGTRAMRATTTNAAGLSVSVPVQNLTPIVGRGSSYLTVRSSEPRSIDEWVETAQIFQDLITVAMDAPCAVLRASLAPADERRSDEESLTQDEIAVYARHVVNEDPDAIGFRGGDALSLWAPTALTSRP